MGLLHLGIVCWLYLPLLGIQQIIMQNNDGEIVDLYIPRKCSSSGAIIGAKDHASVQIAIVDVDESGISLTTSKMYTVCGEIRRMGESDDSLNRLALRDGIIPKNFNK